MEVYLLSENKDVECVTIPRKLLEQIYMDYHIFCSEEMLEGTDGLWDITNSSTGSVIEKIEFYLKQ